MGFLADSPPPVVVPVLSVFLGLFLLLNFVKGEKDTSDDGSSTNAPDNSSVHEAGSTREFTEDERLGIYNFRFTSLSLC
ncbi:hypothetical protein MVEN_00028400 [Mycena venus]|uniref:Uncharacterized protein n=1 Tax=Mycena venus TaxID=2733690 RepID=A0A8H6Z6Y1_9AGAR|nr:hypothetical protein MVEN_00028400 [Mycena venus]